MKEIADRTEMAASVLSSLYSSVLPTYIGEVKRGIIPEEALDYALSQVNNVSKKRLLGSLAEMKARLFELEPPADDEKKKCPYIPQLQPLLGSGRAEGRAISHHGCRQQRICAGGTHECL